MAFETADESMMRLAEQSASGANSGDAALHVLFEMYPKVDRAASEAAGRRVCVDAEYVKIRIPGSRDEVHRQATEADRMRFPRQYQAFKLRQEEPTVGTPLAQWALISRSDVENLSYYGLKTLEQLASCPDGSIANIPGGYRLKSQAQAAVKVAKDTAHVEAMRQQLAERDSRIEVLERQMKELIEKLDEKVKTKKAG